MQSTVITTAWIALALGCGFRPSPATATDATERSDASVLDAAGDALDIDADVVDGSVQPTVDAAPACAGFSPIAGGPAGSRYRIHGYSSTAALDESRYWMQARDQCVAEGGYLAIVNSQAELTALDAAIPQNPSGDSNIFHVGITDAAIEGTWLTVLGQPAPYLVWASGQPSGGTSQNCGAGGDAALWDVRCDTAESDHRLAFACECNP